MVGGSKSHMAGWTYHTWLDQGLTPHGCNSMWRWALTRFGQKTWPSPRSTGERAYPHPLSSPLLPLQSTTDISYLN